MIAAVLIAPSILKLGVPMMAAHLFLVYYASLSAMTPPVAVAAFAAAPIALANPMKIGFAAVRIAIVAFVVPFAFVYSGELLLSGAPWRVAVACATAVAAVACLCLAVEGCWHARIGWIRRVLFLVAGVCMMTPSFTLRAAGALIAVAAAIEMLRRPPQARPAAGS